MVISAEFFRIAQMKIISNSSGSSPSVDGIEMACYVGEIPEFVQEEMDHLYGNIFASLEPLRAEGKIEAAVTSTYVVREHGRIRTIFLFRNEKGRVHVINEVISINGVEIRRFVEFIFLTFKNVSMIAFRAIHTDKFRIEYPHQRLNYLEDIVVTLPDSEAAYLASLGKNTRRNVKRYMAKLMQDVPDVSHEVYFAAEIEDEHVQHIVDLNVARMESKEKYSAIDKEETALLISQAHTNGLVYVVKSKGHVIAGAISFQVGANYFLNVLAHDPQYDEYSLGTLCCFLIINECIARKGKEFHFLWGRYPYKYALMGLQRDLDYLAIYRSKLSMLRNFDVALVASLRAGVRKIILWLSNAKQQQIPVGIVAAKALGVFRYVRWNMRRVWLK